MFRDGEMLSLITVEYDGDDKYLFHATSPRRTDATAVGNAIYRVGWQLFSDLSAKVIYTLSPTINGHRHHGSHGLALICGLTAADAPLTEQRGRYRYEWQRYELTREHWLKHHVKDDQN